MPITLREIYEARHALRGWVRRSPLVLSPSLSARSGSRVYLKLETTHDTRAFKIRGATNRLLALSPAERERGVVTVSTGNHGLAVAYAAQRMNVKAVVCMSALVPNNKREAISDLDARIEIVGNSQDEAEVEAARLGREEGLVPVHPFDDPQVIAGQGTIGLELLEDLGAVDCAVVPLSGGGLISGIALALKSANPGARIIGVSMERGAAMYHSVRARRPVAVAEEESLADSLGGGIGETNAHTLPMVQDYVDDLVLLSETQIAGGMRHLYWREGVVAEGGGSVAVAALLRGLGDPLGGNVVCVVSGSNVDMTTFTRIVSVGETSPESGGGRHQ